MKTIVKKKADKSAVTFECGVKPDAKSVYIVGEFNDWNPAATRMIKRKGTFRKRMELTAGVHEYKFVVDGEWTTDPTAETQVANVYGSTNSVIRL